MTAAAALAGLIAQRLRQPFVWGVHDCCLWAADAVQAQTGRDPAAGLRGTYRSALGAARLVRRLGGLSAIAARGGEPIAPALAVAGDVGLVMMAGRPRLVVCGGGLWLAAAVDGLAALPWAAPVAAWRVARNG